MGGRYCNIDLNEIQEHLEICPGLTQEFTQMGDQSEHKLQLPRSITMKQQGSSGDQSSHKKLQGLDRHREEVLTYQEGEQCIALHTGIVSNKMYLLGTKFEAVVDHKPLLPLFNSPKRPKQMRVDRHRMKMGAYDFNVFHMAGDKIPCDYGSRAGCLPAKEYTEAEREEVGVDDDLEIYFNRVVDEHLPLDVTRTRTSQAHSTARQTVKFCKFTKFKAG